MKLDINSIRADFPLLSKVVYGKPLVYLDSAASAQSPLRVIEAMQHYVLHEHSNVHRGVHYLSQQATNKFEEAREKTQQFINAKMSSEVIFTKGTTESINVVASSFGRKYLNKGDEVLISTMEHHANIVPWQMICQERGAHLKVIPITQNGEIIFEEYEKLLCEKTKIVAITHVSNVLGTINPIKKIVAKAHEYEIPVLVDGAQAVPHQKVDVQELDCDFYVFSGHKMYGPTGIGVLYGKEKWLDSMPPYQGGGEMIKSVSFEKTTYNDLPFKFEAGTPNIAGAIGLEAAIAYLNQLGVENVNAAEKELLHYATQQLLSIENLSIIGNAKEKASVVSFLLKDIHPYDVGIILDRLGIAVRTGHHCAEPLMDFYKIHGTVRASFALYNTKEEVDKLVEGIQQVKKMFA